jgi:hypothetical protein
MFAGRPWFLIATILFAGADASQFISQAHAARTLTLGRRRSPILVERARWDEVRSRHFEQADSHSLLALGLAVLALVSWLTSLLHRESRIPGVLPTMLATYLVFVFTFL